MNISLFGWHTKGIELECDLLEINVNYHITTDDYKSIKIINLKINNTIYILKYNKIYLVMKTVRDNNYKKCSCI